MSSCRPHSERGSDEARELRRLQSLGPEAQGDVDTSLLEANLRLTPLQRIEACQRAVSQVAELQVAMKVACDA